jgi:hypothetical protein
MKAGNSINRERVATSVATVASGISSVRILKRDNHLCQNCLRNGRAVQQRPLTTSRLRLMGVPMMIRTSKACAGPAIERKPGANASNDIDSHLEAEGGGQIPDGKGPKDRRLAFFHTAAG